MNRKDNFVTTATAKFGSFSIVPASAFSPTKLRLRGSYRLEEDSIRVPRGNRFPRNALDGSPKYGFSHWGACSPPNPPASLGGQSPPRPPRLNGEGT